MDHIVGAFEAKTHLSKLLERVTHGESFTITRHGMPIAVLQPLAGISVNEKGHTKATISAIKRFRQQHFSSGTNIKELLEDGRD